VGAAKHNIKRFKKLTTLSVGVSHIEDEGAVALFLSRLCPLGCEIECGVTSNSNLEDRPADLDDNDDFATGMMPAEFLREVNKRRTKWNEVQRLLPLLTRSRMEERELCSALVDEVEDLRVQNHILSEKGKGYMDGDGC